MVKKKRVLLLILFATVVAFTAMAQNSQGITMKFSNEALSSALQRLEKASGNKIIHLRGCAAISCRWTSD